MKVRKVSFNLICQCFMVHLQSSKIALPEIVLVTKKRNKFFEMLHITLKRQVTDVISRLTIVQNVGDMICSLIFYSKTRHDSVPASRGSHQFDFLFSSPSFIFFSCRRQRVLFLRNVFQVLTSHKFANEKTSAKRSETRKERAVIHVRK